MYKLLFIVFGVVVVVIYVVVIVRFLLTQSHTFFVKSVGCPPVLPHAPIYFL
jgi:hypothetical protein